jgi:hypothetical protein
LLEQKEPKIQECRIASGRHSALRAWVATLIMMTLQFIKLKLFFYAPLCRDLCKVCVEVRGAERKPGGDSSVLDFWFFLIKKKERKQGLKARLNNTSFITQKSKQQSFKRFFRIIAPIF